MTPDQVHYTTPEAAARLGVGTSTLRRWAKEGRVRHVLLPSGRMRFLADDLDAVLIPKDPTQSPGRAEQAQQVPA